MFGLSKINFFHIKFMIFVVQKQYFFEFTTVIIINFLGPDLHLCYKNIMQTQHLSNTSYGKHRRNLRHPLGSFFLRCKRSKRVGGTYSGAKVGPCSFMKILLL